MRRNKFEELASACIDGELSPDEEKLFRDELRRNPEHRALFALYKRMNGAVSRARFPFPRQVERRSPFTSTLSWAMSGVLAGVLVSFAFIAMRDPAPTPQLLVAETLAAFEAPENIAVFSDEKFSEKHPSAKVRPQMPGMAFAGLTFSAPVGKKARAGVSELPGAGAAPVASLHPAEGSAHGDILSRDFSMTLASCTPDFSR
jgi:hypothetical protein